LAQAILAQAPRPLLLHAAAPPTPLPQLSFTMSERKASEQEDSGLPAKKQKTAFSLGESLAGMAAIVTGSSSGVGAAVAMALAKRGCGVAINYNSSKEGAEKTAEECRAAGEGKVIVVQGDVGQEADCKKIIAAAVEAFGRLDMLVNNAGTTMFCPHDNLDGITGDDFMRIYQTNTVSAFNMIKFCMPHFKAAGGGRVVNVASHAGVLHTVGSSLAYINSKAALVAMTRAMGKALGPTIRVNAICPGFIEGEWLKKGLGDATYDRLKGGLEAKLPLRAVANPDRVAENVLWLLTAAPNITGEAIVMDGGLGLMVGPAL